MEKLKVLSRFIKPFMGSLLLATIIISAKDTTLSSTEVVSQITSKTSVNQIQPYSDRIEWRYKYEDGKYYKRLFNYSTASWVGDWILVG